MPDSAPWGVWPPGIKKLQRMQKNGPPVKPSVTSPEEGDRVACEKWMERRRKRSSRPLIHQKNITRRLLLPLNRRFALEKKLLISLSDRVFVSSKTEQFASVQNSDQIRENSLPVCSFHQKLQHVAAAAAAGLIVKDALLSSSKWVPRSVR